MQVVYFLHCEAMRAVKIGTSDDVRRRIRELQTGIPYALSLLGTVPAVTGLERAIHGELSEKRLRGEWFSISTQEAIGTVERLNAAIALAGERPKLSDLGYCDVDQSGDLSWAGIIRTAVRNSDKTQYRTALDAGMGETQLARFMAGTHGLSVSSFEKLAGVLGLELVDKKIR